ncbi:Ku protein [Actinacidiphila glaucinigra]|uniref:Ku protein n=1 Tax=Actinacidiphila glaucinigra TaxID=235986 RepID=UPI0033B10B49
MRAIWTGYVSFGLVTIPVHLYSATEEHGTGSHQVHASDGARIRHRRVCEREDVEVPQSEIARGWEVQTAQAWRQIGHRGPMIGVCSLAGDEVLERGKGHDQSGPARAVDRGAAGDHAGHVRLADGPRRH